MKFFFGLSQRPDDTDVEKWCLIAVARLSLATEFGNKLAAMDKFGVLFVKANDTIADVNYPRAGHSHPCDKQDATREADQVQGPAAVRRDVQGVVERRRDMQDFQRVAALGIRNLAGSFDLRALAGKMGALEAVVEDAAVQGPRRWLDSAAKAGAGAESARGERA